MDPPVFMVKVRLDLSFLFHGYCTWHTFCVLVFEGHLVVLNRNDTTRSCILRNCEVTFGKPDHRLRFCSCPAVQPFVACHVGCFVSRPPIRLPQIQRLHFVWFWSFGWQRASPSTTTFRYVCTDLTSSRIPPCMCHLENVQYVSWIIESIWYLRDRSLVERNS